MRRETERYDVMEWYEDEITQYISENPCTEWQCGTGGCLDIKTTKKQVVAKVKSLLKSLVEQGQLCAEKYDNCITGISEAFDVADMMYTSSSSKSAYLHLDEFYAQYGDDSDIIHFPRNDFWYRTVKDKDDKFFTEDELYRIPPEKVHKNGRYNETACSTMYISNRAKLSWYEARKLQKFTLAKFRIKNGTDLVLFQIHSGRQFENENGMQTPWRNNPKQVDHLLHYLIMMPLYSLMSIKDRYECTIQFMNWLIDRKIASGVIYTNCQLQYDGRECDGRKITHQNYNIAIPATDIQKPENLFEIEKERPFDLPNDIMEEKNESEQISKLNQLFQQEGIFI